MAKRCLLCQKLFLLTESCISGIDLYQMNDLVLVARRLLTVALMLQCCVLLSVCLLFVRSALVAHTLADAKVLFDRFNNAARRFGLTVSLKKTGAMCQSYQPHQTASASITARNDIALKSVDKFCYLGSFLSNTVSADSDITSRLAKAGSA